MTSNKALTVRTLLVGATLVLASAAFISMPLSNIAIAKNGGGNGNGNGGGNGGGHGNGGGNGNGNGNGGNSGGKSSDHATNDPSDTNKGQHHGTKDATPDDSPTASELGKLNGFFHAAPEALKNASPNSAPGSISQTFRDALKDFAAQQEPQDPADGTAEDPNAVSMDDLAHVLAEASNKKMSPNIVQGILDRLTEVYGDDYSSLSDGETPDDATDDTTGDTGDGTSGEEPEPKGFAQDLSDRVNEINGYSQPDDEEQNPS